MKLAVIFLLFNRLAKYEDSYYPHNFTGQMVEDFEWVLSLLN